MILERNKAPTSKAKQHHNSMVTAACNLKNNNIKEFEFSQAFSKHIKFLFGVNQLRLEYGCNIRLVIKKRDSSSNKKDPE